MDLLNLNEIRSKLNSLSGKNIDANADRYIQNKLDAQARFENTYPDKLENLIGNKKTQLSEQAFELLRPRDITDAQPVMRDTFLSPLTDDQIKKEDSHMIMNLMNMLGRGGSSRIGQGLKKLLHGEDQIRKAVRNAPINPNPVRMEDLVPSGVQMQAPINFRNLPLLNRGKLFQQ